MEERLKDSILAAVEGGFERQIELTKRLIRFPTRRAEETAAQDFVFDEMVRRGWKTRKLSMDEARISRHPGAGRFSPDHSAAPVIVGEHAPKKEVGRSLILQSHIDIVPEGPAAMWSAPPYEPHVDGEWLYGRGSADMKAGHASMFAVLDALASIGLQPAATVTVQSVVEEESTGNGALQCHLEGYRADAVLIPEPTQERLTRANVGVVWFRVEVAGKPVHASIAGSGRNAIEATFGIIHRLRELEASWNARKDDYPEFRHLDHPINLNIGKIEGGDWTSSVPAWCAFDCRMAIFPGEKPEQVKQAIEQAVREAAELDPYLASHPPLVTWTGFFAEGYVLEAGSDAERILANAHQRVTGQLLADKTMTAYLDGRVYSLYDKIPTLVYGPKGDGYHGFDERVSLGSLRKTTGAMALFVAEWCGLEPV